nr:phosphoethanolamine--lipid A transferase [Hyphomicrobium methylovorum]
MLPVAAWLGIILNQPFWSRFYSVLPPQDPSDWLFFACVGVALVLIIYIALLIISVKPIVRIAILLLLPISAAANYFMNEFGLFIDVHMVRNVFETDVREASDLLTFKLIAYVVLLGILPAVLFCFVPWTERSFKDEVLGKLRFGLTSLALLMLTVFPAWGDYLSVFRTHRELRLTLVPLNYVSALVHYARHKDRKPLTKVAAFGEDAHRAAWKSSDRRKSLFVIVVGETARADHFSLNGYEPETNPELAKVPGLVNYPKAYSCGTDTAQSVPCMFSGLGREHFSNDAAERKENLLDILKRTGIDVRWRDNQAGCKGVCARVPYEFLTGQKVPTFYPSTQNYDGVLLNGLEAQIASLDRDTVIVLHMMGSHGPAYWKRYPEAFEKFKPVCKDVQFSRCDLQHIVNAYDNTLVYTDHVLAQLIGILGKAESHGVDAGMLFVSDHGESLGERNMYLHGMPYAIAPEAQIHVPMMVWLTPSMRTSAGIDNNCLIGHSGEKVSHDNLFHSVLGIMHVASKVYDPKLDFFAGCRTRQVQALQPVGSVQK